MKSSAFLMAFTADLLVLSALPCKTSTRRHSPPWSPDSRLASSMTVNRSPSSSTTRRAPSSLNPFRCVPSHISHHGPEMVLTSLKQGEGGIFEANELFLRTLRKRCDAVGAALIFDEIQVGKTPRSTVALAHDQHSISAAWEGLESCGRTPSSHQIATQTSSPWPSL